MFSTLRPKSSLKPFPNKPWFSHVCNTNHLKTPWEKEKLLVKSNFSFSHSVFYSFGEHSATVIKFENYRLQTLSVWKSLKFGKGLSVTYYSVCKFPNKLWFLHVCSTSLMKTLWGKDIARNKQFFLFPHCFLFILRTVFHFHQIWNCRLQSLSVRKSLKFVIFERANLF